MGSRIRTSGTSRARVLLIGLCQLLLLSSARASTSPPHQWWLDQTYLTGAAPSFTVDQTGVIHATTYSTLPSPRNTYWRRDDNCHWGAFAFSPGNDPRPQGFNTSVAMGTDGQPYIAYVGHTTMSVNSSLQARIAHYAGTLTNPWTLDSLSLDAATEHQVNVRVSSSGKLHVTFVGGYLIRSPEPGPAGPTFSG